MVWINKQQTMPTDDTGIPGAVKYLVDLVAERKKIWSPLWKHHFTCTSMHAGRSDLQYNEIWSRLMVMIDYLLNTVLCSFLIICGMFYNIMHV